jgi:outer membrane autotransporter protein
MLQPLNPDAPSDLNASNIRLSLNTIQQRLFRLRTGMAANDSLQQKSYYVNNEWHEAGTLFAGNDGVASDATGTVTVDKNISEYGKLGVFINAAVMKASQTNSDVELKSDAGSSVLTIGTDYRFMDNLIGGLAFNITRSSTDFDDQYTSGSLDSDGYALLLYGSYYVKNWFFDASLTMGGEQYQQQRTPAAALGNAYDANFHGSQYSVSGTAGYDFAIQSFTITPFTQLTIGSIDTDGYRETAANPLLPKAAPLGIDQHTKDIGNLNIGSHFRYIVNTNRGVFIPGISLTAVNDFENDAQVITGFFVANANDRDSFALKTNAVDSSYFVVALGFSFQLKGGNSGFVNVETVEGYENLDQQRLTAGWRWEI